MNIDTKISQTYKVPHSLGQKPKAISGTFTSLMQENTERITPLPYYILGTNSIIGSTAFLITGAITLSADDKDIYIDVRTDGVPITGVLNFSIE